MEDLDSDNSLATLMEKLNAVFLKVEKDHAYEACSYFDGITMNKKTKPKPAVI